MFNTVPDTNSNPIFSSYSVRSANYNENMDEFVKAPNDIYIEEQKKKQSAAPKKNVNADALNGIPDMPEFLKEEHNEIYKMPEWLEKLNIASEDEIQEWKNKGGMGIAEAWERNNKWAAFAPYVNTTKDAADAITVSVLLNRAKNGEELTYEQQEKLTDYLRDMKELQVRGFTFGGGTVNAILTSIPYLEEFGIGLAASESGVGLASLGKTLSTIGAKRAARKAVETALKEAAIKSAAPAAAKKTVSLSAAKKIYKDTLVKTTGAKALANVGAKEALKETGKALPSALASSAKFGLTKMPEGFLGGIADKQIATGVYVTDYGDAVFTSSEHLATSIMKSFGESTFEALTETAGWTFSPVASYFAKPIQKVMPKSFFTGFEKLVSSRYGIPAAEALRKYGYDGVIEEMGEELLNRFLCQTFGLNGLDEYNFDGFMNNVFYANDPSQWGQEALSFAAVSGAGHIAAGSSSKIADEWNKRQMNKEVKALTDRANRYIQSPEQFYLEQGLIKIKGSQSLAEQKLRDIWTSQNIDEGVQNDVLKNMSETEIRAELKRNIEENSQDISSEAAAEKIEKDLTKKFIENKTFAREKDARSVAALFSAPLQKLSEVTGLSLEEVMQEEMPDIQREAEAAAKENGRYIHTDGRIEEIFQELDSLPDDFNDENYLAQLIDEVDILSKIRDGALSEDEFEKAKRFINTLEMAEYTELANELRELHYNQTGQYFQTRNNIEDNFDGNVEDITEGLKQDVINLISENDLSEDEFQIEDVRIYGSYSKGTNKASSDLDLVVLYSGSMREDDAFNIFNDEKLTLTDKNGNEVEIDINPINKADRGSIDEYLSYLETIEPKTLFQSVSSAGAEGRDISAAKKEWEEKGTESKYFKKWSNNAPLVKAEDALNYNFKTGEKVAVEGFHGTQRADRVGSIFKPERATSGPMAFFSSDRGIASNYAESKNDTSIDFDSYYDWFKININGEPVRIDKAWNSLSYQERKTISERAPHVTYDEEGVEIIYDENINYGVGNYDYAIKEHRGNALETLVDSWLDSGSLFDSEEDFIKVLKLAGVPEENIIFDNPHAVKSDVYDVYLSFKKPIVTNNIPQEVVDRLEEVSKEQPIPQASLIGDLWNKNQQDPNYWIERLKNDISNKENSFVWTSIPDWVTDTLKEFGYDGVIDVGGKAGGLVHKVYIPFASSQVKSQENQGTFDEENPDIYYQTQVDNTNNLIMAHATKAERIDDIIETGEFVAPSMSITKKGSGELANRKFGDVLFVRNPRRIDFQNDNIYDRDIYSPRLPAPDYELPNGHIVDAYQRSSMEREWKYSQEKFKNRYDGKTFDEYFKDAKKVLFLGYTPSGNRKYKPYRPNFLLEYIKKNKLVNGENVYYGFSNFLAKFSKQQSSKEELKETAASGLAERADTEEKYDKLRDEYNELYNSGIRDYAKEEYSDILVFDEYLDDILHAIATNNKRKLSKFVDTKALPKELYNKLKEFTERALSLPRSYFEAKPMRKVDVSEFPYAVAEKGTLTQKQKDGLKSWGVKVLEYENGDIDAALREVETNSPEMYFQSAYHGTPHRFEEFSLDNIGSGEGAQVHGWGLYFAEDREVSETYRKSLSLARDTMKYDGKDISKEDRDMFIRIKDFGKDGWLDRLEYRLETQEQQEKEYKDILETNSDLQYFEGLYGYSGGEAEYRKYLDRKENIKLNLLPEVQKDIKNLKQQIKKVKNIDESKITAGQLFEVEIPDNNVLLDETASFSKQSKEVQASIEKLIKNEGLEEYLEFSNKNVFFRNIEKLHGKKARNLASKIYNAELSKDEKAIEKAWDNWNTFETENNIDRNKFDINSIYKVIRGYDFTGKDLYSKLTFYYDTPKQASEVLNKYGIKGITYYGNSDGRCYVVFDDKAVKVLEKYYQEKEEDPVQTNMLYDNVTPRKLRNMNIKGAFVPAENLIELFKNADESTIIHEFAHWWLSRLEKYAENNDELALDLQEVRKFVKNNGEKFTREQHEKFAVGFEAYIRNGSARSNRLKRIFEDFKNALIQIYDSIRQLVYTEGGEQYSFNEEDVANLEKLFERLLTTENERIRKTVFERCDDINDKIKEIKSRQEQEMKELDEIYKDNIAINNRASDKKRKVQEYLDLAEGAVRRVPKEVKEMKKRYKDATIDILSVATGMTKQQITNPRNFEKVQMALEKTEDRITVSGGMRGEWEEFYTDTGVNYDTDDVGGGYKLAEQAFEVFADGTYNFNNMNEDDIGDFYGKFDYLYNKVQSLKGEEKATAFEALCSLFGDMPSMPDEVVQDLVEKLGKVEIEYEEGQKEDFNRKSYPSIPVVQQLQYYVTRKLSDLKVYDPNVRYKVRISKSHSLYKAIQNATSVNSTKRIVRKINEFVIADLENQAKAILHKEIQKQIRVNSKLVKVGTLSKGKFDWKTNTVFAELAEINKLKQKEALKEYGAIIELDKAAAGEDRDANDENVISTPELKTDFQSNLKRKFLEYRSSKIKDLNLLATRSLLEDIMTLKFEGRRAKDAEELEKQLQKDNMKTDLAQRVRALKGNKAAQAVAKFIMGETALTSEKTLVNWETALNALFGKEVSQRYSLLRLESDAEVYAYKHYADFCQKAIELYGLNNPVNAKEKFVDKFNRIVDFGNVQPLIKLMQEYEEEVYNYKEVTFSKETGRFIETGVQLSRAEIITLYAWSMNEELEQRIFTQYGLHQVQHMFEQVLSDEDKQFAWLLIDTCEAMYDENNEVFIRTMGLSLPKVENYFPSKTVRVGSEIDMLHENVVRSSNPSFIKQRKTCNRIKMKPEQPISILLPHINKTARYVILSERLNYLNAIFKDATVRAAIKEVFDGVETPDGVTVLAGSRVKGKRGKQKRTVGDRIHDTLLNQLGASTFENYVRGLNVGKSWADTLAANYITSRIGGNAKVMFGQLTSVINYAEKMPAGLWSKGFVEGLKTPKETFKYMMNNCDYLKARLAGNSMNEIMSRITDESDRFRTLRNFCATNTKYGDIFAICFGGKPYIDYLISQGMSKEEAFDKFVEDTLRAQQSGHNSATSVWQKKMSENFFTRMMFAFNNTSLQYERKFLDAVSARAKGDIGNKDFIKALLLYKVFNPIIFTSFLGNLSLMQLIGSLIRGDGDDDTLARFGIDAGSAMVFSNMGAYGFAGMGIKTIIQFAMAMIDKKEYKPFLSSVPIISDIEEIGKDLILKNEVSFADWVDAMAMIGDDATGVPVSRLTNAAGGIGDVAQGEAGVGILRMLGYGNYRAHLAATGEPPKKSKKK